MSVLRPRTPRGPGWLTVDDRPPRFFRLLEGTREEPRVALNVVSTLDLIDSPDGPRSEWHVSVSRLVRADNLMVPTHATDDDVRFVVEAFRMRGAEEDNHARYDGGPGVARHFWLAVDPAKRRDCECKETEETVVMPDGYAYQRPKT